MQYFLDLSNLTVEDIEEIKHLAAALNIDFQQALHKYMDEHPDKIKVLGEIKNGEILRDEIDENGVKEYRGKDAIIRIIESVMKNKKPKKE